ncbi:unnamed protein product, partial [Lampetra fluviatilis]
APLLLLSRSPSGCTRCSLTPSSSPLLSPGLATAGRRCHPSLVRPRGLTLFQSQPNSLLLPVLPLKDPNLPPTSHDSTSP